MKLYKCSKCGNVIEIVEEGSGKPSCCGVEMKEMKANTAEASSEKHIPKCVLKDDMVTVYVGEVIHPMEDAHYICFVAAKYDDSLIKYYFKPGEEPIACFDYEEGMEIYAYCNLHGLWKCEL